MALSHGHYDHTGGVAYMLQSNPKLEVYCHPAACSLDTVASTGWRVPFTCRAAPCRPSTRCRPRECTGFPSPRPFRKASFLPAPFRGSRATRGGGGPFFLDPMGAAPRSHRRRYGPLDRDLRRPGGLRWLLSRRPGEHPRAYPPFVRYRYHCRGHRRFPPAADRPPAYRSDDFRFTAVIAPLYGALPLHGRRRHGCAVQCISNARYTGASPVCGWPFNPPPNSHKASCPGSRAPRREPGITCPFRNDSLWFRPGSKIPFPGWALVPVAVAEGNHSTPGSGRSALQCPFFCQFKSLWVRPGEISICS